jgi:hypothetical protein
MEIEVDARDETNKCSLGWIHKQREMIGALEKQTFKRKADACIGLKAQT